MDVVLSPREIYEGCLKRVDMAVEERCAKCDGTGAVSPDDVITCLVCQGGGRLFGKAECPGCNGRGRAFRTVRRCAQCTGKGTLAAQQTLHVRVPAGLLHAQKEPQRVLVEGKGDCHHPVSGRRRDIELRLHRSLPPDVSLDAASPGCVVLRVPVTLQEVLCGFDKTVDAFDGAVSVRVAADAYQWPGRSVEFPEKGLPVSGSDDQKKRGPLRVVFEVRFPEDHQEPAVALSKYRDVMCRMFSSQCKET